MESFYTSRLKVFQKSQRELCERLNVKINFVGRMINFEGEPYDEYAAKLVFEAIDFGFSVKDSLLLLDEDFVFKKVHIKDHTRRKDLVDVRSRLIGTKGKTRRVIESISDCDIIVGDGDVGILGEISAVEGAETAIINLIKGTKQSNVYRYLEERNTKMKQDEYQEININKK